MERQVKRQRLTDVTDQWLLCADDASGVDVPVFVKEAVNQVRTAHLSPSGEYIDEPHIVGINDRHAWLVAARQIFVWSLDSRAAHCRNLRLPSCGLPYLARHVHVDDNGHVVCASPAGAVRAWSRHSADDYVDHEFSTEGHVVHSIVLLRKRQRYVTRI